MKWVLCLFFGVGFAQCSLSICAIFKNEAPFLREWIEFHKIQGVSHFFLYNNESCDDFEAVLQPYIEKGEVTVIEWPFAYTKAIGVEWVRIQKAAYMDAIERFKETSKWIAFIDIDEFLFCPTGETLPSFLSRYEEFGGVCVNWLMFGTSGCEDLKEGTLLIEALTRCSLPDYSLNYRVKSIVNPNRVAGCFQAHFFKYKEPFFAVSCYRMPMSSKGRLNSSSVSHHQIRINHYWTRTERYFREFKIQSRKARRASESEEALRKRAESLNISSDFAIQQFVPELKRRLQE